MNKARVTAIFILLIGGALGYFVYASQASDSAYNFKLGLDLKGGTQLVYKADLSKVLDRDVADSMDALRDVVERRVNLFGVAEPNVQTQTVSVGVENTERRLVVELPGVTNIDDAIALIGQTPILEFKTERDPLERDKILAQIKVIQDKQKAGEDISALISDIQDPYYVDSPLTGRYLKRAQVEFSGQTGQPQVSLVFDQEGSDLFASITKANVGKTVAIYLDGQPISTPTVQAEITGGTAQITGGFTPQEAKQLAGRLNSGALPIPIVLVATAKIGATLGEGALAKGLQAAMYGFLAVALFLILWYRVPGLVGALSLVIYGAIALTVFKLIPITLTSAGIAGFVLSIGMAVDANVLIFERLKDEKRKGKQLGAALEDGFTRAWTSIRDSNISSLITASILFWFGTSMIQGFALTWAIGILTSMLSAVFITKRLMRALYSS